MSQPTAADDTAPATMRAVVVTRPGGLDALEIKDVQVPARRHGWVRIKVKAFGVNESEVTTRKGESDPEVTTPYPRHRGRRRGRPGRRGQRAAPGPAGGDHDGRHGPHLRRRLRPVRERPRGPGHPVRDRPAVGRRRRAAGDVPDRVRLPDHRPRPAGGADAADPRWHLHGRAERGHARDGPRRHRTVHHPQPGAGPGAAGRERRPPPHRQRHRRRPGARADAGRCRRRTGTGRLLGPRRHPAHRPSTRHRLLHRSSGRGSGRSPTSPRS